MNTLHSNLRGVGISGLTWGLLWVAALALVGAVVERLDPGSMDPGETVGDLAPGVGLVGIALGVAFAGLLLVAERKATLRDLPLRRLALWGFGVAAPLPVLTGVDDPLGEMLLSGALGAVSAVASGWVVRTGTGGRSRLHARNA